MQRRHPVRVVEAHGVPVEDEPERVETLGPDAVAEAVGRRDVRRELGRTVVAAGEPRVHVRERAPREVGGGGRVGRSHGEVPGRHGRGALGLRDDGRGHLGAGRHTAGQRAARADRAVERDTVEPGRRDGVHARDVAVRVAGAVDGPSAGELLGPGADQPEGGLTGGRALGGTARGGPGQGRGLRVGHQAGLPHRDVAESRRDTERRRAEQQLLTLACEDREQRPPEDVGPVRGAVGRDVPLDGCTAPGVRGRVADRVDGEQVAAAGAGGGRGREPRRERQRDGGEDRQEQPPDGPTGCAWSRCSGVRGRGREGLGGRSGRVHAPPSPADLNPVHPVGCPGHGAAEARRGRPGHPCRRTISPIQAGAYGEVQPGGVG